VSMVAKIEDIAWEPEAFEKTWIACNEKIITEIMADKDIEQIKQEVRQKGHVTAEHKDQFIRKVNEIKNKHIAADFGEVGSDTYHLFLKSWEHWLKLRGKDRPKPENMFEENIGHLLYGSTPDPDLFLKDFDLYADTN